MNFTNCELKAAASKESRVVSSVNETTAQKYSVDCASWQKATSVSMSDSFIGDLASMNVDQTKLDTYDYEMNADLIDIGKDNHFLKKKMSRKLEKKKQKIRKNNKFQPHFGMEEITFLSESFKNLKDFSGLDISDDLLRKIEGLFALFANLKECTSYTHFISAVFLYVRDFYSGSVTSQVMKYLKDVFDDQVFTKQSGSLELPNWLVVLRNIQDNWTLVKSNKAFGQLSKLIGVLVTLGLCDASMLQFSVGGFQMFDKEILQKHMSAVDVAEAVFGTVSFFVEGAYLCFKTGSIRPLLINDMAALELDEEYITVIEWWDLVRNGNLERHKGFSDAEFSRRVDVLIAKLTNLMLTLKGLDKKLVADKLLKCRTIKADLTNLKISSGIRRAPFAIEVFGESNQGKTTFADQLVDVLLTSVGMPIDKEYRAALNPGDKFFSNWTTNKTVAILDDMANEQASFVERPPTRAIIDICNNQMYYAPKAELEAKGKCFVEPEIVVVTTNVKDLDAHMYSNCPYSVQRRMHLVYTVRCKDMFQKIVGGRKSGVDSDKIRAFYTDAEGNYNPPLIDDIWEIDMEVAMQPEKLDATALYVPICHNGKQMKNVSAMEAIQCSVEWFNRHRENQFALINGLQNRNRVMKKCPVEGCPHVEGICPTHKMEQQFGLQTAITLNKICRSVQRKFTTESDSFLNRIEQTATNVLYKRTTQFLEKWDWICVIPSEYMDNENFVQFVQWYYRDQINNGITRYNWSLLALCFVMSFIHIALGLVALVAFYVLGLAYSKTLEKRVLMSELRRRNDSLPMIIKNTRDRYAKYICAASAGIAALYVLSKVYKSWRSLQEQHGSLEPQDEQDVAKRDAERNVWQGTVIRELPLDGVSMTSCHERLAKNIEKSLRYVSVDNGANTMMANMLFLKSNVVVIPDHYFEGVNSLDVVARRDAPDQPGGHFACKLHLSASYLIPNTDLRVCYCPTGGTFKDITQYFPDGELTTTPFRMLWRFKSGEMLRASGMAIPKMTNNGVKEFKGVEYAKLSVNTFAGMCGAVLLSEGKGSAIIGFHLGGIAETPRGCAGTLTRQQVLNAIEELRNIEAITLSGSASQFNPQCFGVNMLTNQPLHPKSPINYLPSDSQFEYYGTCIGASTYHSDVRQTPISDSIALHTGQPNIWGQPKFHPDWFGWSTCLINASHPGKNFPHDLLMVAAIDYKKPLLQLIKLPMWRKLRPLTDHENLNGIPGCRFIDAIKLDTSVGYPLGGAKRRFVIENEPTEESPCNREFEPIIMDEINRVEALYKQGLRAYTIAKACKKDEILPVAKEKCRIFYGNSVTLTFLVRKYYLPMLRFLQMNPLVSECAVGINCYGPEWDQFYKHVTHHGMSRLFGGDYGKYDQKLPSQLLLATLRILRDLARECEYSEQDLITMEAMSGDLVYSLIAFNGDLVGLTEGTHISGNSLTAVMNGICGCLNLRCFFFTVYDRSEDFRRAVHIMTYGDDNIGSVSKDYPLFNIKGCSEFLEQYGQVYTMPDKTSELKPYLNEDEFEFLKRKNVYHAKLGVNCGALLEKSVFKSLHCFMRPKGAPLTPLQACALNIDTALREWFVHGPEIYEKRRQEMIEVAKEHDITHMCMVLDWSYDDHVRNWHEKYTEGYETVEEKEERFTPQSGPDEDEMQYTQAIKDVPFKNVGRDFPLFSWGELDLVFQTTLKTGLLYVIVEVKRTNNKTARRKAAKQMAKWDQVQQLLAPTQGCITASYIGMKWTIYNIRYDDPQVILEYLEGVPLTPFICAVKEYIQDEE